MKHKIFSLAILAIASILSCGAVAQNYDFSASVPSGQTLYFRISEGKAVVVNPTGGDDSTAWDGYTKPSGALAIPSTVTNGSDLYPVAAIDDYAFYSCGGITELTIPDTQSIGQSAFASCEGLSSLNLGSVREIAPFAFQNCDGLTSVTFPRTFVMTGVGLFAECDNLVSITVEAGNPAFDSRENCNAVINSNTNILLYGCKTSTFPSSITGIWMYAFEGIPITSAVIPNRVQSIDAYAFSYCSHLSSLTLGSSLRSIGEGAFAYCRALTGTLAIPDSVASVGDGAFYQCSGLTGAVVFPDSVQYIGTQSFAGCSGITSVTIGNSSTQIGHYAFAECTALASLNLGAVYQIGVFAFRGCTGLTAVTLPRTFVWTGTGLFADCVNLASIVVEAGNPAFDSRDNCNALVNSNTNIMLCGCKNSTFPPTVTGVWAYCFYGQPITSVVMPESMEYIDDYAFYGCDQMTTLVIGDSIRTIGELAFAYCSHLTDTLVIPDTVTSLGQAAFAYCGGLRALRLGKNVATIGEYAFAFDANIASIESKAAVPPTIAGPNTFYNVAGTTPVTVPCPSVAAYRAASGWNQFSNIQGFSDYLDTTVTACDSFSYSGISFTASTDTAIVLANVGGCDSIVTLHLTVNHDSSAVYTVSDTGCYTWLSHGLGTTYCTSGTYARNWTTVDGCFGKDTLNLTIIPEVLPSYVPASGLMAYYPFNGDAADASGNGNHGTPGGANGGPAVTTDRNGNVNSCYEFGGYYSPNWIDVPNSSTLQLDTAVSISFWLQESNMGGMDWWGYYSASGYEAAVLSKNGGGSSCPPGLYVCTRRDENQHAGMLNTGIINASTYSSNNFANDRVWANNFQLNQWFHCVMVVDGRNFYVYHDGALVYDTVFDQMPNFATANSSDMILGIEGGYHWYPNNCKLDDIGLWNRALTETEVLSLYTGQLCYCLSNRTLTDSTGTLADGSGNDNYLDNTSCQWLIQPSGANSIELTFTEFNTESGWDFVTVYDGATTSDPVIGSFSGNSLPEPLYSTGGSMLVRFTSDGSMTYGGWSATYRKLDTLPTFTIVVVPDDTTHGTVTGGGRYNYGSTATLTATADSGYVLYRWSDGATENPHTITVRHDDTLTAFFAALEPLPAHVPASGLMAYYPFNGNAIDASGNGNHGIPDGANGGPAVTTDRNGNVNSCYEFGGHYNRNWITVPNSDSFHLDTTMSVSFWMQRCERGGGDGWNRFNNVDYCYAVLAKGGDGYSCAPGFLDSFGS